MFDHLFNGECHIPRGSMLLLLGKDIDELRSVHAGIRDSIEQMVVVNDGFLNLRISTIQECCWSTVTGKAQTAVLCVDTLEPALVVGFSFGCVSYT